MWDVAHYSHVTKCLYATYEILEETFVKATIEKNFQKAASEINIRCKELSLTTPRVQKNSYTLCSANKNSKNIKQSHKCLLILKMIFVSIPKDACTTYPNWNIKKFLELRFIWNLKLWKCDLVGILKLCYILTVLLSTNGIFLVKINNRNTTVM